jgi:hypothetical protein
MVGSSALVQAVQPLLVLAFFTIRLVAKRKGRRELMNTL